MKIQWFSNACVKISSDSGGAILCDPWVNPGANLGSWFHWPPVPLHFEEALMELRLDGIFISHLHSDHYDPKFIARFTKLRPNVPIYIPQFAHPWLKASLHRIVKNKSLIIELPTLVEFEVGPGLTLKAFAADTCNPLICMKNVPCQPDPALRGIDGIGVFKADGLTVVNANDAMGIDLVPKIAANIGRADVLMGHYGAASPFPQCFSDVTDKKAAGQRVIERACATLLRAADAIDAKYIFPFAGQYLLGGRLVELNKDLAVLALDKTVEKLGNLTRRSILSVEPFGSIDFNNLDAHKKYVEPNLEVREKYLSEIREVKFPYEKEVFDRTVNFEDDLLSAANSVIFRSRSARPGFDNSFVISDGVNSVTLNIYRESEMSNAELGDFPSCDVVTRINMPTPLLRVLSQRRKNYLGFSPLHWNQADGGSHFIWERTGEFDLNSHMLLNFFGT